MSSQPAVRVDSKLKQPTSDMTVASDTQSAGDSPNDRSTSTRRLEVSHLGKERFCRVAITLQLMLEGTKAYSQ